MSEKLGLFLASCFFLVVSFLGVVFLYPCLNGTLFHNILLGVFTGTITLCPLSAISYIYERKTVKQQFIHEVLTLISSESRILESKNVFNPVGYSLRVKNLSKTIVILNKVSKKGAKVAQEIQNIFLKGVPTLKSSTDLMNSFRSIVTNVNSYLDELN